MRLVSSFVSRVMNLSEPPLPPDRINRVNQALRRRLDDSLEEVFQRACLSGDLETAADLLDVLERMHARRIRDHVGERRINDDRIRIAREELERRQRAKALEAFLDEL